jgi:hypothetical protein
MTAVGKIDTHHHFFPRPYVEAVGMDALARVMPNKRAPQWSPDATIAMMDAYGIDEAILSISPVPPHTNTRFRLQRQRCRIAGALSWAVRVVRKSAIAAH